MSNQATQLTLLHSGADYFPALLAAIKAAQRSVWLETYMFADDATGNAVRDALLAATSRGVAVRLLIDGYGSGNDGRALVAQLQSAGIDAKIYRPQRWWQAGLSPTLLRRLHRKLCVVDAGLESQSVAFVGGINILDDSNHAPHSGLGLGPRFDFAVRITGGLVGDIAKTMQGGLFTPRSKLALLWRQSAALVQRDNVSNRHTIQKMYLKLLASARHEVWIANAYFMPGRRMRRALLMCAQRGVRVNVLLQGRMEYRLQHYATQALYGQLLAGGVHIYEYHASFLHAKVAVADQQRATVGSSNIDPFSLLLAREANVLVHDAVFASELTQALRTAAHEKSSRLISPQTPRPLLRRCLHWVAYGVLRFGVMVAVTGRY